MSSSINNIVSEDGYPPRILIIDDNPRIHRDFEMVLSEEPENSELAADEQRIYGATIRNDVPKPVYTIEHAHSGHEGIEKIKIGMGEERFYQLAFVDIRMPGIDGVETIAQLWQLDPRIQMVICTAYADYSQEDLIQKLGQTDKLLVLKKPFDSIEVTQLALTLTSKWFLARQAALKLEQMELLISQRTRAILDLQRGESRRHEVPKLPGPVAAASTSQPRGKQLPLILIVVNDVEVCRHISQVLENKYNIIEAQVGRMGVELAQEMIPDLIIVDDCLPQVDGSEFCRTLKAAQLTNHIPIIFLAVSSAEDRQLKSLEAGADDCIIKPLSAPLLEARVDNLLESRRKLRAGFHQGMALQPRELAANQTDARFLSRTIAVIEQNMSDFEFDVDVLAQKAAVSRRQLFRKIKAIIDTTPKALIRTVRLKRAAQLLTESEMTITEITFAVGFQDVKYFRTLFKAQFGVLPSEYIKGAGEPH